jgi:hypothetical protein
MAKGPAQRTINFSVRKCSQRNCPEQRNAAAYVIDFQFVQLLYNSYVAK